MDLRDWLIIIGVVIIVGILVDGYRRMRLARRDSLQMSRDMGGEIEGSPLDDDYNPELPSGGARVIAKGDDSVEPEAGELDFGEQEVETRQEPIIDSESIVAVKDDEPAVSEVLDESITAESDMHVQTAHAGSQIDKASASIANDKADNADQEVLVINVDCKNSTGFAGTDLKGLLEACGMDHGEMSIFHRHEEDDLLSPIQFSVANAVEPGYFDPNTLEQLTTPGVSFFMSLPGPKDYMKAFDYMLETAQAFARNLDGELKDEHRSVMTAQTIEHSRQRIREFERKQLSKARS